VLLGAPGDALAARVALAEAAEHTLDAQYYTWAPDRVGRLLSARLLAAADRGVRIRLLVDDIELRGRDARIAALDAHPNIEIRLFNPFAGRSAIRVSRTLQFLTYAARLDHRMHNKAFVADNAAAVVGGRNIGEGYFGVSDERNYRDLDVLVSGPAARDVSVAFDRDWNSEWAVPIDTLRPPGTAEDLAWARAALPDPLPEGREDAEAWLARAAPEQTWAPAVVVADDPRKAGDEDIHRVAAKILALVAAAQGELLLETPYLVLRKSGVEMLRRSHGEVPPYRS
jgi:putative cardiolipin synthase